MNSITRGSNEILVINNQPAVWKRTVRPTLGGRLRLFEFATRRRSGGRNRRGLTLLELLMVLIVLIALAGVLIPLLNANFKIDIYGDGTVKKSPQQIATENTMNQVRDIMMGTPDRQGVWADLGQRAEYFPQRLSDLFQSSYAGVSTFDPVTKVGWRGPYLVHATGRDSLGRGTLVDAWGNEILIQVDFLVPAGTINSTEAQYARLVSRGANGTLETEESDGYIPDDNSSPEELSFDECGDDLVLFFRVEDTRLWE